MLIEGSATDLYDFYHQTAGVTVAGNVYLITQAPGSPACSPTQETAWLGRYDRVWVVFAPRGTYEPPSALHQYVAALAVAGSTRVARNYPGNTDVIVVDPKGTRDGATSLPAPTWESGTHGCLSFYA